MEIVEVTDFKQLRDGDDLLIESTEYGGNLYFNTRIKITQGSKREVILRKKGNHYFNWDMYEAGVSHVQSIYKVNFE